MFCTDKPIKKKENDCLNRISFSKQLANAILSYVGIDNFTISLCGKWGCGKTSIINMVIESIKESVKDWADDKKPIIIKFNPWNYSGRDQLISQFFQTVSSSIKDNTKNEKLKKVSESIQRYSYILGCAEEIPKIGWLFKIFGKGILGERNLESQKNKIINLLSNQNQKIIIVIDDIDRLNNEQIRLIFQLVNSLAGFPNMIYLLSFDYDVVVRALGEEQKCDGKEYLEKIIQVPFNVPEARKTLIQEAFFSKLNDILFGEIPCRNFEEEYWSDVFNNCISPFIHSMRDVNRIINVYKFKYELMHEEINCIDLLALTTLQICEPDIYNWIYKNISRLVGTSYGISTTGVEQKKNAEIEKEELGKFCKNAAGMLCIIQTLFPKFSYITGGYNSHNESAEEQRKKQKLACSDKKDLYFNLSLEDVQISNQQIMEVINEYDESAIYEFIEKLMKDNIVPEFIRELMAYIEDVSIERLSMFFDIMIKMQTDDRNNEKKSIFAPVPSYMCKNCCWAILKRLEANTIEEWFVSKIEESNINTFSVIVNMVVEIEEDYGRIGNDIVYAYRIIDESQLDNIEKIILKKIKEFSENENILAVKSLYGIYQIWKHLDKESMDDYIIRQIQDVYSLIKYLSFCTVIWSGGGDTGWSFKEDGFSEYISAEKAYEKVKSLKKTYEFSALDIKDKEIAVAYYVWYNSDKEDHHSISQTAIHKLIPEWEVRD